MSRKSFLFPPGIWVFLAGSLFGAALSAGSMSHEPKAKTVLENDRVLVQELHYTQGTRRPGHIRSHDQVIVFLDDAHYEVSHPNGRKESRTRKRGDVIWHSQGESAPLLTSLSEKSYHTLVVYLK
ncbi:MAG: hypothetical protein AB1898_04900 [Acidobacteriota bacterium]